MNHARLLFLLIVMMPVSAVAADSLAYKVVRDVSKEWQTFESDKWSLWEGGKTESVYLNVDAATMKGTWLRFLSAKPVDIFVNKAMAGHRNKGVVMLSIDSLVRVFGPSMTIGIFQKERVVIRESELIRPLAKGEDSGAGFRVKAGNYFLNFSILAVLILAASFVMLFRTNPRLTMDYLNVPRLFSVQAREDNFVTIRVTSSVNLLFYTFCSACCSLSLLAIFYFGSDEVTAAAHFPIRSTAEGFLQWFKLMVIVAFCLGLKLVFIYGFSTLFRMRDTSALQFFNFIRMLFLIVVVITLISIGYFIYYGYPEGPHIGLLRTSVVVMSVCAVMAFLKLMARAPFRFFHLFSYLCASEIIPLVILVKILLY